MRFSLTPSLKQSFVAGLLSLAICSGVAHAANSDGLVKIDNGQQLHVVQSGSGPYTVIFEAGFASDLSVWRKVAPAVAKQAQVWLYSRAGNGQSPARESALDVAQSSAELAQALTRSAAKPPYILVGHSYGGFLIRHFAANHPQLVAGMVFVDPADEGLEVALRQIAPERVLQDQRALQASIPAKWQGDLAVVRRILDSGQLSPMPPLPEVPAVVLSSVRARENSDFFQETPLAVKLKRERHQVFFSRFGTGAHRVTVNSGHHIQLHEPELVISAIDQVIQDATHAAQRRAKELARQALLLQLTQAGTMLATQPASANEMVASALRQSQSGEMEINTIGFDVLSRAKQAQLASLILQYNANTFAQSDNAADSYGEALLATGQLQAARQQFQRALALGQSNGRDERTLRLYRDNLNKTDSLLKQP